MDPIETITAPVTVLMRDDIDTDQIIPARYMKRVERTGFGEFAFHEWRAQGLELPANRILVSGENFGCGSSREHAPWALKDYGFDAIIARSFADIFKNNCAKNGLLTVELDDADVDAIAAAGHAQVDLAAQEVRWDGGSASFDIDPEVKRRLIEGLDDISLTLAEQEDAIAAFEQHRERSGPVTTALTPT